MLNEEERREMFNELRDFWGFYFHKLNRNDTMEVRLMNIKNRNVYYYFEKFCKQYDLYQKNNCQTFLNQNQFALLKEMFEYEDGYIINNCKVCYSINPRRFAYNDEGKKECGGGYNYTKKVHIIALDIEKVTHEDLSDFDMIQLTQYCDDLKKVFETFGLKGPMVITSGAGIHFLYKIEPQKITLGKKEWFKQFIDGVAGKYQTKKFHFDALKDFTRVFGMPLSLNLKRKKQVRIIENPGWFSGRFKIKTCRIKKAPPLSLTQKHKIEGNILDEPLVKFLMNYRHVGLQSGGPLSRNNYLELPLAALLRDNNLTESDIPQVIEAINNNMNKKIQVSPLRVPADYRFSKRTINKWSRASCDGYVIYE